MFPLDDTGAIEAGVAPISQYPVSIDTAGTYNPFSATLTVPERISDYEWSSSVPQFTLVDLVGAEASAVEGEVPACAGSTGGSLGGLVGVPAFAGTTVGVGGTACVSGSE